MERARLPLDQVLAVIGLTGRFAGDDPGSPTHLRLAVADRAVLWPVPGPMAELEDEILAAVADMIANASQLERADRRIARWAGRHLLDPDEPRTHGAFQLALVLDDLAERLLTRSVLNALHESTDWRVYLQPESRAPLAQEA